MTIPRECKRLIEVDFPIAAVSTHSAREKSIRHCHPSTLHLWWARRPLAACRAVLMGLLLPDPADPLCPNAFKEEARRVLAGIEGKGAESDLHLRCALLDFVADFADWDNSSKEQYYTRARALVRAAYPEETPLVVDPFAGGGSIPLEALRLGCEAFASDLNPVACLILKAILEDIPHYGPKLAEELRRAGAEVKSAAERELAEFYPPDPDGARPIAYLWARTVLCESPNCGAEIPLARSFWLSKKRKRRRALRWKVERRAKGPPEVVFEVFEPKHEKEVPSGTVTRAKATCPACGKVLPPERVRAQLAAKRGGADVEFDGRGRRIGGARLLAVVTLKEGEVGRRYRLQTEPDYEPVRKAMRQLEKMETERLRKGVSPVPDEPLPPIGTLGFRIQRYGMLTWGDLFSARQKLALAVLARETSEHCRGVPGGGGSLAANLAALAVGKTADLSNSGTTWKPGAECPVHMLASQKIPPFWDFAEAVLTEESSGSFFSAFERSALTLEAAMSFQCAPGQTTIGDARKSPLPTESAAIWFTDPPYYDAVPYADLSDFFFVWLKRTLPNHPLLRDPFDPSNPLTPKAREAVQDETKEFEGRPKDKRFFEETMADAFAEGRRVLKEEGVGCVVFAHKTTEGWEALLSGMVRGGWTITGSWPITTEMSTRLRARDSAALSASVHLVCRPRPADAIVGGWEDIVQELPRRIYDWVERLSGEGIRGADLVFSCIGPAMELYSRYPRVETADGREVNLDEFLAKVWEVLGQTALQRVLGGQEEAAGALEEDARLTALFLWTLQSTAINGNEEPAEEADEDEAQEVEDEDQEEEGPKGRVRGGYSLPFDIVRRFAQPLGIHLADWEGRVIETEKGAVRLLPISAGAARLFGGETTEAVVAGAQKLRRGPVQAKLFPESESSKGAEGEGRHTKKPPKILAPGEMTTLDRVYAAMLLQTAGQSGALREFLEDEIRRGPQFLRLANALSALYPKESEEKRLLDAVLLAVPRR